MPSEASVRTEAMNGMASPVIHRVTALDLAVKPWAWPFAQARRAEIDAHFAEKQREKPALWNGRVLLGRNPVLSGERFSASYFETDFASFLAWRDWGFPDKGVFNGFGMGALLASDGAFAPGEALRGRIEANLAAQQHPELSAIHLVHDAGDLTAAMPRFVTAFLEAHLS